MVNVGFGGAPASPAVQDLMRQAFPNAAPAVGMGYGSSESVAVIAGIGGAEYRDRPTSCGQVAIGFETEIRGPDGEALPTGQEGEIWCRSAYTMLGLLEQSRCHRGNHRLKTGGSTPATSAASMTMATSTSTLGLGT